MTTSIPFKEYALSNGLHVILAESHTSPIVVTNLWYHVGSKDEETHLTGFAHLFEHLMFQGSKHVGKAEHFKYIQNAGGLLNATTSSDRTNYFETLPSGELELALWLESDRLSALDISPENFENQRDVVKEERRQRYENQPYGLVYENILDKLFPTGGYHWPTIGSMKHLEDATLDDVRAFHNRYYKPNNCSLAIVGDFEEDEARRMIEFYFGGIEASDSIDRPTQQKAPVVGQQRIALQDNVNLPAIYIAFQAASAFSDDEYALDYVSEALARGRSSRLYHRLVWEERIAKEVSASHYGNEKGGVFMVSAKVQMGESIERVEDALWEEIERIKHELVSETEHEKLSNQSESSFVRSLAEFGKRADHLQRAYTYTGDTNNANLELSRILGATREAMKNAAERYLDRDRAVVLTVLPR